MQPRTSRRTRPWTSPRTLARTGGWLLLPIAVLDWFALAPQGVVVTAFLVAVAGLAGLAAALVLHALRWSLGVAGLVGVALVLGGLVVFGLDPFPGTFPAIASWWPAAVTQPQVVGSAYWIVAGLGVELAGVALLGTLLVVSLTTGRERRPRR